MPQVNAIPISLGGTGETTAEAARIALGIAAGGGAPGGATNTLQFNLGDGDFGGVPNSVVDPSTGDVVLNSNVAIISPDASGPGQTLLVLQDPNGNNAIYVYGQSGTTSDALALFESWNNTQSGEPIVALEASAIFFDDTGSGHNAIAASIGVAIEGSVIDTDSIASLAVGTAVDNPATGTAAFIDWILIGAPEIHATIASNEVAGIHIEDLAGYTTPLQSAILINNQTGGYAIKTGLGPASFGDVVSIKGLPALSALVGTTGAIGGSALTLGQQATADVVIAGASAAIGAGGIVQATPLTEGAPGDGFVWNANLTATDTITVKVVCLVAGTPTSSTYDCKIF